MSTVKNQQKATPPGLQKLAYASAVIGGGVVGSDYAAWLDLNPLIGAVLGSVISVVLTGFLLQLQNDPDGKILETCMAIGGLLGAFTGIYIGLSNAGGAEGFFGGLIVGTILGTIAGRIVAALISLAAFALLFMSRGPVGLFLRQVVLKRNEGASVGDYSSVDVDPLSQSILTSFDSIACWCSFSVEPLQLTMFWPAVLPL